jgi:hypothetical protein
MTEGKRCLIGPVAGGMSALTSLSPVFINLDNVLTPERQGDLTTVLMLGGETIHIDTMPETLKLRLKVDGLLNPLVLASPTRALTGHDRGYQVRGARSLFPHLAA